MHFRTALAVPVLRRWRRGDQGSVDDSTFTHHQTLLGQVPVDGVENLARDAFCLEQMTKLQQRRRVRRRLAIEVDTDKTTDCLAIVNRIFDAFIGQAKTLLGHVHAQHAGKADRRAARTASLGTVRLDQLVQLALRRHAVDLGEEAVAPRQLLLGGVFEVGKASLHDRLFAGERANVVSGRAGRRQARRQINQRFPRCK